MRHKAQALLLLSAPRFAHAANQTTCSTAIENISIPNTTIAFTSHHSANTLIQLPGTAASCNQANTTLPTDLCRIVLDTVTSASSSVHLEAWLPHTPSYNGRMLASGGGGLGGCIDYPVMQNGATLGFAALGMNGGHNGSLGPELFLGKPETITDFGERAMHVQAVVGKELIRQYYAGDGAAYSYYMGCSTGGRQGFSSAIRYPSDFDGMVLGAAGVEWIRIVTQWYLQAQRYGWPDIASPGYVSLEQFQAVVEKTVDVYDGVDGVVDGIIDEPGMFRMEPQRFACGTGVLNESVCLRNAEQVDGVRLAYEAILDDQGRFVYPGYQLGADPSTFADNIVNGSGYLPVDYARDYFRGIVYNDTEWSDGNLSIADIEFAYQLDVGRTNTKISEAYMGDFKQAGGKIVSYHGRADPIVPSELSEWWFNGVRRNMNLTLQETQDFYRLFFVPGMSHCEGGPGAWNIGQKSPLGQDQLDNRHSALLALQNWVEKGEAPEELTGTKYVDDNVEAAVLSQRKHCVYPKRSVWDGQRDLARAESWNCV